MIAAGIDAGSRAIKVVLFSRQEARILSSVVGDQGIAQRGLADELLERAVKEAGLHRDQVTATVATGYGRSRVTLANTTITEITCHARGVHHFAPDARTIIEMGGQDSKVISIEAGGRVRDFAMNDRCAAGTGRFLEMVASRLGVDLPGLEMLARESREPAVISSMCAVFAETEIIGLLADGRPVADIVAGIHNAVASRVVALAGRSVVPPVCFTGGVALQPGMAGALSRALNCPVSVSNLPQFTGALGAAILAGEL